MNVLVNAPALRPAGRIARAGFASVLLAFGLADPAPAGDVNNDVDYTREVVYQILTDRFVDGNTANNPTGDSFSAGCVNLRKYCGGDWAGIAQRISDGYLTQMGITALWITQPVENIFALDSAGTTAYHGFWARDYKRTNPAFGSMTDFANLISVAHAAGIKVIIDFTPNHSSSAVQGNPGFMEDGKLLDNGVFVASLNNDPTGAFHHNGETNFSTYEDGIYRSLFNLADYNHQNATIDSYMKAAIKLWLDQGIDGIRVDAVKHMPPGWSKNWVDAIYAHRPVYTFGEWFLGTDEVDPLNHEFANDSGMSLLDFRFNGKIRKVLRDNTGDWNDFYGMISNTATSYDQVIDQLPFIDNHDMPRFHFAGADTRRTDMALAVTLTSRGTPIVYYGTEQYMTGGGDPDNRKMMTSFSRTTRAYQVIQKLSALRQSNPALGFGTTQQRWINSDIFIYERKFANNVVLVAINRATSGSTDITGLFTALPAGTYTDVLSGLLTGNSITVNSNGSVNVFNLGAGEVGVWQRTASTSTPTIGHVGPVTGRSGETITIEGEGFGTTAGSVLFGSSAGTIVSWTGTRIKAKVPNVAAGLYNVVAKTSGGVSSAAYPKFEILTGPQVSVRFVVDNATTFFGQNVYLTGSVHELSNWSTSASTAIGPMFNQVVHLWPTWYYDVSVPAGRTLEYKFIKLDGAGNVVWEGGFNHVFTTPASGTAEVTVTWQN